MAKIVLLIVIQALLAASVSSSQKSLTDTTYLRLIVALCSDEEGTLRKSCLQSVTSGTFIDDMFTRLYEKSGAKNIAQKQDSILEDVIGRAETVSTKRGREKMSGFYSNW